MLPKDRNRRVANLLHEILNDEELNYSELERQPETLAITALGELLVKNAAGRELYRGHVGVTSKL